MKGDEMSRSIWENGERRTPGQLKINLKLLIRLMLAYAFYIQDLRIIIANRFNEIRILITHFLH